MATAWAGIGVRRTMPSESLVRTVCGVLLSALLVACGAEEPLDTVLGYQVGDEETAQEVVRELEGAGIPSRTLLAADLDETVRPAWIDPPYEGWVFLCRARDEERARPVVDAYIEALQARSSPPDPEPEPLVPGTRRDLDAEELEAVRRELARRHEEDQAVRKNPVRREEMPEVDADNTAYLRGLVQDVGWIDAERFGRAAADAAFLIAQHGGDLQLMRAALPEIEKDVRAGRLDPQDFALLYDRIQIFGGGKQRYGTQIAEDDDGMVVWRLEDPDHVDERRAAIGLGPLADYLRRFDGEVRIER